MNDTSKEGIIAFLEKAEQERFYGEITFAFREGNIYLVRKNESLKLEDLGDV